MSTVLVAAILVGFVAAICLLLSRMERNRKRKLLHALLHQFSLAGSVHNLRFTAQEVLHNAVIGIDGMRRRLLVLRRTPGAGYHSSLIDLAQVRKCTLKKHFATHPAEAAGESPQTFLHRLCLQLEQEGKPPAEITFYKHFEDHEAARGELEVRALHWEALITKMLPSLERSACPHCPAAPKPQDGQALLHSKTKDHAY